MRLPQKDGKIDIEQTKEMVDKFLEAGFTYFDTAWAYAGSEDAIRQAVVERYPREKFQLATKNAAWINCKTREEAISQFETSLKQTGAGYFDFYLLHNLGEAEKSNEDFVVMETNIDDCGGEIFGYTKELLFKNGALDVFFRLIYMKKNRPAYRMTVACRTKDMYKLQDIIFRETITIGMRYRYEYRT